jgi:hypothetical protein
MPSPSPELTGAEIALLRALPQRIAAQPNTGAKASALSEAGRRRRLQNWGLLTIRHEPDSGAFLVMITDAGVAALAQAGAR